MSEDITTAVRCAHQDIQDIFRANQGGVAQACTDARDRLAVLTRIDTDDPAHWDACKSLCVDLGVLLGFLTETSVPCSEPAGFRSLVLSILWYLYVAEQNQRGLVMAREIHRRWTAELGPEHLSRIAACERHATFLFALGEAKSALPLLQESAQLLSRISGPSSPGALLAAVNVCACLNETGNHHEALRLSQNLMRDCEQTLGRLSGTTIRAVAAFAGSMYWLGEYQVALDAYADVYQRRLQVYGKDHLESLNAADSLAITQAKAGNHEAARTLNEDALRRYESLLGKKDERYKSARDRLIANLRALGQDSEADALWRMTRF